MSARIITVLLLFSTIACRGSGTKAAAEYPTPDFDADYRVHRKETGRTGPIRNTSPDFVYNAPTKPDWGKAFISPNEVVEAGTIHTWTITYIVGPAGLEPGDGILVYVPHSFTVPQVYEPPIEYFIRGNNNRYIATTTDPGYTTARASRPGVHLKLWINREYDRSRLGEGSNLYVTVTDAPMAQGDTIQVIYGDTRLGSPGAAASPIEGDWEFPIVVYRQLDWDRALKECIKPWGGWIIKYAREYAFIERPPIVRVVGREAEWFTAVVPTIIQVGETFPLTLVAHDRYRNTAPRFRGKIKIEPLDGLRLPRTVELSGEDHGWKRFEDFGKVEKPGVYRVMFIPEPPFAPFVSNPIVATEERPAERIFWGELHVHSIESDGNRTAEQVYEFAKGPSALNFCAVSDHADRVSAVLRRAAGKYNDPVQGGHVNFYFRGDSQAYETDFIGSLHGHRYPKPEIWRRLHRLGPREVVAIPHLHAGGGWDDFDTTLVRNVEIYSIWGNGEYLGAEPRGYKMGHPLRNLREGLDRGYHLGFVAGGDEHAGLAGWGDWLRHLRTNPAGLTAARAPELNREAIFNALWNRNVYAVTGAQRIYLDFRADGHRMGTINSGGGKTHRIQVRVEGTSDIDHIAIIRNGSEWKNFRGSGPAANIDETDRDAPAKVYYYVRVVQKNEDLAWSSPVWFEPR